MFTSCNDGDDKGFEPKSIDLINNQFSEAEQEVKKTFAALAQSIIEGVRHNIKNECN